MLYRILKRMVERGNTKDLQEKLDVFYTTNRITKEQYTELIALL